MAGLKTLHQAHHNFAKTLLKNMHSYLHFGSGGSNFASGLAGNPAVGGSLGNLSTGVPFITVGLGLGGSSSSNQSSDEQFKRIVELLPLNSRSMNMELLEIYIAILQKLLNEVLIHLQKKSQSIRKRRRVPIVKIILASLMDCANSFPILREFIFGIVYAGCKKCFEAKSDLGAVFESFLVMYLCKLGSSLEEKAFKQSLELLNSAIIPDEKQKIRLLYNAVVHFPTFMDHYKTTPSIKDKLKAITFENYQPQFLQNTDLYRAETMVDDLNFILKCFPAELKGSGTHQSATDSDLHQTAHSSDHQANGTGGKTSGNGYFNNPESGFGGTLAQGLVQTPQSLVPHSILVSGKIPVYNIPVSSLLPAIMLPALPTLEELEPRLEPFFVFVNMFLFRRKYQLFIPMIQEDKFCDVLLQLLNRIHRHMPFAVLKTYCIMLTFFNNLYSSFDKKVLQVLSELPKECLTKLSHSEMRKLGIIFLTHNMPRSSTFFFYTPKKDAKKIKFFAYFDSCKRLAGLKTSRRGPNAALSQDQGLNAAFIDELHKSRSSSHPVVLVFASLKEFKFSHEYLKLQSDIHMDLFAVFTHLAEVEQSSQHAAAAQEDDFYIKRSAEGTERRNSRASPHMSIGNLDAEQEEVDRLADEPLLEENLEKQDSAPPLTARDRFERLQSRTLLLVHLAEHYLEDDSLSRSALLAFAKFLSLVMRFLESFEFADAATLRKTKQHLQDFLNQKGTGLFSSDLYYYFKIRKVIGILESGIDKAPVSEVKMSILKYLSEIDYLMLPRSVFISNKTPKLHTNQGLLWQFRDKQKVSSLQEHVVECEIEVQNLPKGSQSADSGGPSAGWVIEAEITCTETVFNQVRFTKKAIKTANNLLSFSFLLHFDTACPYRLSMSVKLLNRAGFQIDHLTLEDHLDVV